MKTVKLHLACIALLIIILVALITDSWLFPVVGKFNLPRKDEHKDKHTYWKYKPIGTYIPREGLSAQWRQFHQLSELEPQNPGC